MHAKNRKKLIQNSQKNLRPPPFWQASEIKDNHLFVTNMGSGARLGNKLFEFASVFGVAKHNNRTPVIKGDTWRGIDEFFDTRITLDDFSEKTPNVLPFFEPECHTRNNATRYLPQNNVTIGLYLISRRYFEDVEVELRRELMFKDAVIDAARRYLSESFIPPQNGTTFARVVIHVRRGDLLGIYSKVPGFMNDTSEYFSQSMIYFRQCYDRVQFIVMSDDIKWCKMNIVGPDIIYSEEHSPGFDLAVSSLCDHAITTRGTFGIWLAWFASGITIRSLKSTAPNSTASINFQLEQESYPLDVVLL